MLTANAMTGFKEYVKRTVCYAEYKVSTTWHRANISKIYINGQGKVVIDFTINPAGAGSVTVNEVRLIDTAGQVWLDKVENITRKSNQSGIFYRFTIDIREVV